MFQNTKTAEQQKPKAVLSNIISIKYIIIYLISFLISMVPIAGEFAPFAISFVAACLANSIPAIGIIAVSLIGNFIKFGIDGALTYLLTTILMIATFFIIKPKYNEEEGKNEQIRLGKNLVISTLIVMLIKCIFKSFTLYDIIASFTFTIIAYVFYKIFVNSIIVLEDVGEKRAFTIEEVIGTSLLISIALTSFSGISIFGISLSNVLSILVVLILGWKNGVLVGATAGVTIGVTLGVITKTEPIMISAYALSGMIAGILNRFGKLGVIIGFVLGNIVLAYVSNGYTKELIHFKEILIASIGLLLIPKKISIDIENFIPRNFLPIQPEGTLNRSRQVSEELNNASNAIQDMARAYKEGTKHGALGNLNKKKNKEIFEAELFNNLEPYKENMLYEDIVEPNGKIVDKIFEHMLDNQEIKSKDLIRIFKECNSYIIGSEDEEVNKFLQESIKQIVGAINVSYKISKSEFIWKKKIEEVNKNAKDQLNTVSQALDGMAKSIKKEAENENEFAKQKTQIIKELRAREISIEEISIRKKSRYFVEIYLTNNEETAKIEEIEEVLTKILKEPIVSDEETIGTHLKFLSKDKFKISISKSTACKTGNSVSGDSLIGTRLKDGNYLIALSDGMGTGKEAHESSSHTLRLLENLLLSGFESKISLKLINSTLLAQDKEEFATLDIAIIDLYKGRIEFIKSGACPSYVKNKKRVQIIKANSLPAGIVSETNLNVYDRDISDGDILLMCSDGILDSNVEYQNKELWVKYLLEDMEVQKAQKMANLVLTEAIDNNYGRIKDDLSVIICKFKEI